MLSATRADASKLNEWLGAEKDEQLVGGLVYTERVPSLGLET